MKYTRILVLLLLAAISGCKKGGNSEGGPGGGMPVSAILAPVIKQTARESVEVPGSLSARDEVTIVSELDSTVKSVNIKEGQHVKAGEILFKLDDTQTSARFSDAEAAFKLAEISYKRNKDLLKSNTISQQVFDQSEAELKSTKAQLALAHDENGKAILQAPFEGFIGERYISAGQFVRRGEKLTSLVKMAPLDIIGDVPEQYSALLKEGLNAEFTTDAHPDQSFSAKVVYISPSVDKASRTVRIKAETTNTELLLKPGMFGRMELILQERPDAIHIPEACIRMQDQTKMTVRVNKKGIAEFAPVTTGLRSGPDVEVLSGLSEGDVVVVEGWQKMGPGSTVIAAPESQEYGVKPGPVAESDNENI